MTIFALMAIFSIIGVQAEGAEGNEAKIAETGKEYATFVEAVNTAEAGQTVELLQNASFDGGLVITKNLTIDGKGFTLTDVGENGTYNNSIKITGGDVTIQNITIDRTNTKSFGIFILTGNNKLTLTLTGAVTVKNGSGNGAGVLAECNYGTLKITGNGVKFENCNGYYGAIALINNAKADIESVEIVSTVTPSIARNAIGIFNNCTLDIKSGKISGYKKAGIGVGNYGTDRPTSNSSTVTVGDGVVIENGGTAGIELGAAGTVNTSASISGCTYPINISGAGTINVEGGEITGTQKVINATGGTVNVKAGTVTGTANVIAVEGGSVNVSGGVITGTEGTGINAITGSVNIKGGTLSATGSGIYVGGATVVLDGGTINNSARGISAASGTVEVKSGAISGCTTGINAGGATVTVSGGTISNGSTEGSDIRGILATGGTINMTGGKITLCKDGIYVQSGATVTVSGGEIMGNDSGINLADNSKATVAGNAQVTGNSGSNTWIPGSSYLYISGTFSGKVGIKTGLDKPERMAKNVLAAEDFAKLANLGCITNDYDGSRFGYHNGTNFAWTNHPEPETTADSGVYRIEEGGEELGVVRFITEFSTVDADAIESAGTYALNADTVKPSEIPEGTKFESFGSGFVAGANAYAVDVIKIAKSNFDKPVTAVSFVKIKSINTPVYYIVSGAKVNTGKNLGINADSNFDAQEVTE